MYNYIFFHSTHVHSLTKLKCLRQTCSKSAADLQQTIMFAERRYSCVCKCLQLFASSLQTLVLSLANLQQTCSKLAANSQGLTLIAKRLQEKYNCLYSVCNHIAIKIIQSKYLQEVCKDIACMPANQIPRFLSTMFPPVLNVWCV